MKLTKNQQNFIGTQFDTPKGGTLTVIGVAGKKSNITLFSLECSVCSGDKGLWPSGSIISSKGNLERGQIPCGCAKKTFWTEQQYEVLVKRESKRRGYVFIEFEGDRKGKDTKLKLHNPVNGNTWESTIHNFINHGRGCPLESKYNKIWNTAEREDQIKNVLFVEGGRFVGWEDDYKNVRSKFTWVCAEGHVCKTEVHGFVNGGTRCRKCWREGLKDSGVVYGYYPKRLQEDDNLYIIRFNKVGCIKVGRSFDITKRIFNGGDSLLRISGSDIKDIEILAVYKGKHQEVYNTEQWIHEELTERGFHKPLPWSTECFTEDSENILLNLLSESGLKRSDSVDFLI